MAGLHNLKKRLGGWLDRPCIDNPVDRRNAPMLQVMLILLGTLPPLLWLNRIFGTDIPWRPGETTSLAASLFVSAMALFSLALIRRGRFQWAIRQMLAIVAVALLLNYANSGLAARTYEQPIQVMWLFVAGMMIGRHALWGMYAVLVAALFVGAAVDIGSTGEPAHELYGDALIRSAMFLLIAVVVDRSAAAMRDSLAEATRRGQELAAANVRLQDEIAARERTREQLLHAQKVEAVGRMASGVAHDFNHLLTLILGYAGRGRMAADREELLEALTGMESAAQRAGAITHKLLSFSRYDVSRPERFDAVEALEEMRPMLRQTLGAGIRLEMALCPQPCPILLDRAQFSLAILNLTANAAQAMPDGGRFQISASRRGNDRIEIALHDDGAGIPEDVQARMFEPFFTTKPAGQGTGLGLSIVGNLLADAGGTIQVRSRPGEGTTFQLRLPLSLEDGAAARDPAA